MISTTILEHFVRTYGYWALLIGTFLEGETILMIGGLTAQLGYLELPFVMLIAFIGSFSGDQAYFYIGRYKGKFLLSKHIKWHRRVDRVHRLLERYHDAIMLGFRFVYGIRIMTPFVLGMNHRIKAVRFLIFNGIGAVIWAVVVSGGGYLFGHAFKSVLKNVTHYQILVIVGVSVVGLGLWIVRRYRNRQE